MIYPFGMLGVTGLDPDLLKFKFSITTTGASESFTVPAVLGQTYNAVINYGDAGGDKTITSDVDANLSNTYTVAGTYSIWISGKFGGFSFNDTGDKLKVISVEQFGDVSFDFIEGFFYGCTNLLSLPIDGLRGSFTRISSVFRRTGITAIPPNIFDQLPQIIGAFAAFEGSSITAIPVGLHRYNPLLESVTAEFQLCSNLINICEDLYYYNPLITTYIQTFYQNINMVLPSRIFNLGSLSIVTNFDNFMPATTSGNSSTGTIQDVWNYVSGSEVHANAFTNQTALTNYAAIPNAWKGL